jgi:membrane protein implicated in regulation of membrane protease activity
LSSTPSTHSFVELVIGSFMQRFLVAIPETVSCLLVVLGGAVLAVAAWRSLDAAAQAALAIVVVLAAVYVARRCVRLYQLSRRGVEVDANLVNVDEEIGAEVDFRTATYRYEYGGRPHDIRIVASGFSRGFATRHGSSAIALVDPEHPDDALIIRAR